MDIQNNIQSPSFGLSWFSPKGAEAFVNGASDRMNKIVEETIEKVAHTKMYNIEFTTNKAGDVIVPRIATPYAVKLLPPFWPIKPKDNRLVVMAKYDGLDLGGEYFRGNPNFRLVLNYLSKNEAERAYNNFLLASGFDAAAEIAIKLEESYNNKIAKGIKNIVPPTTAEKAKNIVEKLGIKSEYFDCYM